VLLSPIHETFFPEEPSFGAQSDIISWTKSNIFQMKSQLRGICLKDVGLEEHEQNATTRLEIT
jgi:hypothetical protein